MKSSIKIFLTVCMTAISGYAFAQTKDNGYGNGSNPPGINQPNIIQHDTTEQVPKDSAEIKRSNYRRGVLNTGYDLPTAPPNAVYPKYPPTKSNKIFPDTTRRINLPPDSLR